MIDLGVNIDHVATLRQQRHCSYPDPVKAALLAEKAGADAITLHLRKDRRHIQDQDVFKIREQILTRLNFECAITDEMLNIVSEVKPHDVCLVPEQENELTTEGGLNIVDSTSHVKKAVSRLKNEGIRVSIFVDPVKEQLEAAAFCEADVIELHTGVYAELFEKNQNTVHELERLKNAIAYALKLGLTVNAGHGLHYTNVQEIVKLKGIAELNIGHAIVSHALFVGWENAVAEMKALLR